MSLIAAYARAGYHQVRNLSRLANGDPLLVASLNSMTLDDDDVALATELASETG